jgi:Type IV secretion-system coupling protein DNA-binding domain
MSRPLGFPRRLVWLFVVSLVVFMGLSVAIPFAAWVWASGIPLRMYYLGAYLDSSERKHQRGANTEIRWLYKIAPGRQPELANESDVVAHLVSKGTGKVPHPPYQLTSEATAAGWRDVMVGPPERIPSATLADYLQANVYDGKSLWFCMLQPVLWVVACMCFLLAAVMYFRGRSSHEERHGRRTKGPEIGSAFGWFRPQRADGIRFQWRFENPPWSRLPFGPGYRMPRRLESSHILLMGDSGSGKSSAIRQILRQVQGRGESAIVYDPAMDFVGEFYSPARGDLILNPFDARCPYWSLGNEINRTETATTIAAAFLPEKEYEKAFFTDGPRRILAYLLRSGPQPRDILRMMADPETIARMVKGTPLAALLDPGAPAQRAGVLSSLNMVADCLDLLPEWEHTRSTFATSEWYTERKRWVFLTSNPDYREKILPLHSVWLDLFILRMMGIARTRTPGRYGSCSTSWPASTSCPSSTRPSPKTGSMATRSCWAFKGAASSKNATARTPRPCFRSR